MKVLVTGANGMLGTDLVSELNKTGFEVLSFSHSDLDVTQKSDVDKAFGVKPDFVINCAAYTNVDLAEIEKEKCDLVNLRGVENIALACLKNNSVLIQMSTDYVFDGSKKSYHETDKKNPLNYYGLTKSAAEDFVQNNLSNYYIVRTSWLFGEHGKNFVDTISKLADEKHNLTVVDDQFGSPTYTKDLSESLIQLILKNPTYGVYHMTNSGSCSRFEYAKKIIELKQTNCYVSPCASSNYIQSAKRPSCSILKNTKFAALRQWENALKDYLNSKKS